MLVVAVGAGSAVVAFGVDAAGVGTGIGAYRRAKVVEDGVRGGGALKGKGAAVGQVAALQFKRGGYIYRAAALYRGSAAAGFGYVQGGKRGTAADGLCCATLPAPVTVAAVDVLLPVKSPHTLSVRALSILMLAPACTVMLPTWAEAPLITGKLLPPDGEVGMITSSEQVDGAVPVLQLPLLNQSVGADTTSPCQVLGPQTGLVKVIEPLAGYAADAQPPTGVRTKLL